MSVLVLNPNGTYTTSVKYTTTLSNKFFHGTLPVDAITFQVSINGSSFSDDPTLSDWNDGVWTVPSPIYEPEGLSLVPGVNTIAVRAILNNGASSNIANIQITLVSKDNLDTIATPPTNISIQQQDNSVELTGEPLQATNLIGFNFYASLYAGGGVTGYQQINVNLIKDYQTTQEVITIEDSTLDTDVASDVEGDHLTDPQFFRLLGSQVDINNNVLQQDYEDRFEIPENTSKLRLSLNLSQVRNRLVYSFTHNRTFGPNSNPPTVAIGDFASTPSNTPLYYVMTCVYYNPTQNVEFESSYSQEVVAHPITVTTALGSFPTTSRQNIVQEYIGAIFRSNPQIKVEAGSVLRDTVIDPFASEVERLRFLLDFYHRARTPTLLLQIDDPSSSGVSVPVSQSAYKQGLQQALYLSSSVETQNLIDSAFEAYASNFGVTRRSGEYSRGEVIFYVTSRPSFSIQIPLGTTVSGGGSDFITTRSGSISLQNLASYFNPVNGRYQVKIPIRAVDTGTSSNVSTGQVNRVVSRSGNNLRVINQTPLIGGRGIESNFDLTQRVLRTLASVDSGTEQGYINTAADVPGVIKVNVVSSGDTFMQRDLNDNLEHKGGKVDIWVQGELDSTVTDTFAFSFEIAKDIQFQVIGDPSNYILRSSDLTLSEQNPIVEIIDGVQGYEFVNVSLNEQFDLTDVQYLNYNTIQLSTSVTQPTLDLTDVVLGSYRKRSGDAFILPRQPVEEILSVVGTVSGELPSTAYTLVRQYDALTLGRSTLAGDYLRIDGYVDDNGNKVPSGQVLSIISEEHVMIGTYEEALNNLGANFLSVKVYNSTRTIEYRGPNHSSGISDYQINLGTQTTPVTLIRVEGGQIVSGETVLVDYEHDENFVVTYNTDLVVSLVQEDVDKKKHVTADVLVKKAVPVPVDIQGTILFNKGFDNSQVDISLRTNLQNYFNNLRLGNAVRQSDIIQIIESTKGVSYVEVPLIRLGKQDGTVVTRELISTDVANESTLLTTLSSNVAVVYILNNSLQSSTINGGGPDNEFRGVYQSDKLLNLLSANTDLNNLGNARGNSYIVGYNGVSILGYSDDQTLINEGYITPSEISQRRKELTANKVLVSLDLNENPTQYEYTVVYIVENNSGVSNIETSAIEYCVLGDVVLTYDEDNK